MIFCSGGMPDNHVGVGDAAGRGFREISSCTRLAKRNAQGRRKLFRFSSGMAHVVAIHRACAAHVTAAP